MIPEFNIEITQNCNTSNLKMPEKGLLKHNRGLLCNHHYSDKRGFSWKDAKKALVMETDIVRKADANSSTEDEFEEAVNNILDEYSDSWNILDEFDVGVATATIAFSAAGCAPVSSCRGHQMNEEPHPYIGGWVTKHQAELLMGICKEANVGISNYDWEYNEGVLIYSKNIMFMMKFAEKLIENARRFQQEKKKPNNVQNTLNQYET